MSHEVVDAWLRDARPEPVPAAVSDHLASCGECRDRLADLQAIRTLFAGHEPKLADHAVAAIRFELQAEARGARGSSPRAGQRTDEPLPTRRTGRFLGLAAACVLVAVPVTHRWWESSPSSRSPTGASAKSEHREHGGPTLAEIGIDAATAADFAPIEAPAFGYRLHTGTIELSVPPLPPGRSFEVRVGLDVVRVHGTRFSVRAEADRLSAVAVESGVVTVHLSGGETIRLGAGDSWTREPIGDAPASADAPSAAASGQPSERARSPQARSQVEPPDDGSTASDAPGLDDEFRRAWQLQRDGRHDAAALAFDTLAARTDLGARRADVLFWSAAAHARAGRRDEARRRLTALLERHPNAWHADEARQLLERLPR